MSERPDLAPLYDWIESTGRTAAILIMPTSGEPWRAINGILDELDPDRGPTVAVSSTCGAVEVSSDKVDVYVLREADDE